MTGEARSHTFTVADLDAWDRTAIHAYRCGQVVDFRHQGWCYPELYALKVRRAERIGWAAVQRARRGSRGVS